MATQLSEQEIKAVLTNSAIGRIGYTDGTDVYIIPVNYHYEEGFVFCYSLEGSKIEMMRKHSTVCFEVEAIKDSDDWKCVIINGIFEEITDEKELQQLRPRYTEYLLRKRATINSTPESTDEQPGRRNTTETAQVLYRIRSIRESGRSEQWSEA